MKVVDGKLCVEGIFACDEVAEKIARDPFQQKFLGEIAAKYENLVPEVRREKAKAIAKKQGRSWEKEGEELKVLREQAGISRTAVARALGVSPQRIARLETGQPVADARLLRAAYRLYIQGRT